MSDFFEIAMLVSFGISWPINVIKSIRTKSTKGKSLAFLLMIFVGYIFGITSKLMSSDFKWYVMFFYILNLLMVGLDIVLYAVNYTRENRAIGINL